MKLNRKNLVSKIVSQTVAVGLDEQIEEILHKISKWTRITIFRAVLRPFLVHEMKQKSVSINRVAFKYGSISKMKSLVSVLKLK